MPFFPNDIENRCHFYQTSAIAQAFLIPAPVPVYVSIAIKDFSSMFGMMNYFSSPS